MPTRYQRGMLQMLRLVQMVMEQRHLYSIRTAFVTIMPFMIVSAFATALNQMPIPAYQEFMQRVFGEGWRSFGAVIYNATAQITCICAVFAISSNLTTWYNERRRRQLHPTICGILGLVNYVIMSISLDSPVGLPFLITGVTGLFVGMVVTIISTELFVFITGFSRENRLLAEDPDYAVPLSFAAIFPTIVIVVIFAGIRMLMVYSGTVSGMGDIVYNFLSRPFTTYSDSLGAAQLFNFLTHLMWTFGIHGNNVLDRVAQTIYVPALQANAEAVAAGLPPANLITKTLFDVFVYMGGSGTTLSLILALFLFGHTQINRTLIRFAVPQSLLNINEPLIFGLPIVLNPIYFIPFISVPMVVFGTTTLALRMGLVPYTTVEVSWATPIFFSGYAATGSVAGIVLQAVNLCIGTAIYTPFVILSEKVLQYRFDEAYQALCKVIATDYQPNSRRLLNRNDEIGAVSRRLANQLLNAQRNGEIRLEYQPIVDARNNTMHGVEALLRWQHPRQGMISPMLTATLAEEVGIIDKLGLWALKEAISQRARWTEEGIGDFYISVNVSPYQLESHDLSKKIIALLQEHDLPSSALQIEITESVALTNSPAITHNLAVLHHYGVSIAMDDFGVGHSSLLYLRAQPFTTLKLDGSFSSDILLQPANLDIISTIHDLCNLLSVEMIVECVENEEQLRSLLAIGAHNIQGYYFSPPLPPEKLGSFVEELRGRKLLSAAGAPAPAESFDD